MINLFKFLIFGHVHKWKILNESKIWNVPKGNNPIGTLYLQECEHCGKLKSFPHTYLAY